ncbi:MAG: tetratricopeptide repeat protein [Opitutales bacterium]|nr:tetratricopeptide repeat protein [Opitutales bacterium]
MAAELAYNAAVMLEPNNIEWIEGKAQGMISGKRLREAIPLLEELLKRNSQRGIYRMFLANVYVETEQFLKAAQVFELMHSMGEGDMATRLQLANIYSLQGMYDLSVDTFIAAKRDDLVSLLPQVLTTVRYLLDMNEVGQAKRLFGNLGLLDPLWSSENRTKFLLLESSFAALDGNSGVEESKLMEALENDPTEGEALVRLGSIHAGRGEKAKAMFFFERAYTSEKHEYDALILASEVLIESRRFGESLDLLQRALNRQPTSELKLLIDQVKAAALQ